MKSRGASPPNFWIHYDRLLIVFFCALVKRSSGGKLGSLNRGVPAVIAPKHKNVHDWSAASCTRLLANDKIREEATRTLCHAGLCSIKAEYGAPAAMTSKPSRVTRKGGCSAL
jgi:hypothetical protein